jgi:hypothetical protein
VSPAERWLREHLPEAAPPFLEAMLGGLPDDPTLPVPDALAAGALALYARVLEADGGRETALPLLGADALFTHSFQAQSELCHADLPAFTSRWDGRGALGKLAG